MTYISVSAFDKEHGERRVVGGTDNPETLERFYREDLPKITDRYNDFEKHTEYDSFAHAIWCIEKGYEIEDARTQLALRGY
jgi:hypothetical protein